MSETFPTLTYTKRDKNEILAELKAQMEAFTNGAWSSYLDASPDYAILKSTVVLYDFNAFLCDQQVAESFLSLALKRESVIRKAKELGYTPKIATPAALVVRLTYPAFVSDQVIPANTLWSINGLSFTNPEPIDILAGDTTSDVSLIQGTPYAPAPYVSNGDSWQKLVIPVNASNIVVTVNDVEWTKVDTWIGPSGRQNYKLSEDVGGQTIYFEAGIESGKPQSGDVVAVTATLTNGASGNIYETGLNVRPVSIIRDSSNNIINDTIRGTTLTPATGGSDVEDIDSIRKNAPEFFGTQGRAVTERDFKVLADMYPGVTDSRVVGGEKRGYLRKVFVTVYTGDPYSLSEEFASAIKAYLQSYALTCIEVVVTPPIPVEVYLVSEIGVTNVSDETLASKKSEAYSNIVSFFSELTIEENFYSSSLSGALKKTITRLKYSEFTVTVASFATSAAGIITIPVIKNFDVSSCKLKDANENILFSGDGAPYISDGYFVFTVEGLRDQRCTLQYKSDDQNIEVGPYQVLVLKSLTSTGVALDD